MNFNRGLKVHLTGYNHKVILSIVSIHRVNSNVNWIKIVILNHLKIVYVSYRILQNCYMPKMYLFIKTNGNQLIILSLK